MAFVGLDWINCCKLHNLLQHILWHKGWTQFHQLHKLRHCTPIQRNVCIKRKGKYRDFFYTFMKFTFWKSIDCGCLLIFKRSSVVLLPHRHSPVCILISNSHYVTKATPPNTRVQQFKQPPSGTQSPNAGTTRPSVITSAKWIFALKTQRDLHPMARLPNATQ